MSNAMDAHIVMFSITTNKRMALNSIQLGSSIKSCESVCLISLVAVIVQTVTTRQIRFLPFMQFNVATGVGGGNDHGYWQKRSDRLHCVM